MKAVTQSFEVYAALIDAAGDDEDEPTNALFRMMF